MFLYNIPDSSSIEVVADWAEFRLVYTTEELSRNQLGSYMEASSGDEVKEEEIDSVLQELEYRELLYGKTPPFRVEGATVKSIIDWKSVPEYMACLIFALEGNPNDPLPSGVLFERITHLAIKNYIGGESLVVGFPNKIPVQDLAGQINERFNYEPPSYRQDRDLDVIAWRHFGDNRSSQIILLMQCAAGRYWKRKIKDLNLDAWRKYIHFACKPIKGFSIPIVISDKKILEEHSTDAGMILDRPRIYRNIIDISPSDNLREELRDWCNKRFTEMFG